MNATPLAAWINYYIIVGSAGAGLTGLMFVAVALVADRTSRGGGGDSPSEAVHAFGTPTVVHFCFALLVAAILSAPWRTLSSVAIAVGACGVAGVVYTCIVLRRARNQRSYKPVMEDWLWHTIFPFVSYLAMIVTAIMLSSDPRLAMFFTAAGTLLLLFIGIHNAWDTVVYVGLEMEQRSRPKAEVPAGVQAPSGPTPGRGEVSRVAND